MNEAQQRKLEEIAQDGYDFHLSSYLSGGFSLFGKNPGLIIGASFLMMMMYFVLMVLPLGNMVAGFVMAAIYGGYYLVADKLHHNEHIEFGDFFKGFEFFGPLTGQILITWLLYIVCALPIIVLIALGEMTSILDGIFIGDDVFQLPLTDSGFILLSLSLLSMIPLIYFTVAWIFAPLLVIFHKMNFWSAMEMSRKLITKRWFSFFGFFTALALLNIVGMCFLFFGLLVSMPVTLAATYLAFEDITRFSEEVETDVIDHLVF